MSDIDEIMEQAAKEAMEGERIKQAALTNLEFTVHGIRMVDVTDKVTGLVSQTLVASVQMLDSEERHEAWMGGVVTTAQLSALSAAGKLPCGVKQIKDGQAYKLMPANGAIEADKPSVQTKSAQQMAAELWASTATTKSDEELLALLASVGIDGAYTPEGKLALPDLDTQTAAKLIANLR